jgi:hypothetical protein
VNIRENTGPGGHFIPVAAYPSGDQRWVYQEINVGRYTEKSFLMFGSLIVACLGNHIVTAPINVWSPLIYYGKSESDQLQNGASFGHTAVGMCRDLMYHMSYIN